MGFWTCRKKTLNTDFHASRSWVRCSLGERALRSPGNTWRRRSNIFLFFSHLIFQTWVLGVKFRFLQEPSYQLSHLPGSYPCSFKKKIVACVFHDAHVEVKGQLLAISSLLPPWWTRGMNSRYHHGPIPLSHWPVKFFFFLFFMC